MEISLTDFIKVLSNSNKSNQFVSAKTITTPQMNSHNNPYYNRVSKVNEEVFMFGAIYQHRVNNERMRENKETDFELSHLPFGQWIVPNKVLFNKGNFYVRVNKMPINSCKKTHYYIDGKLATEKEMAELKKFLPKRNPNLSQGVKHNVIVLNYNLSNIKEWTMNGETYEINKMQFLSKE